MVRILLIIAMLVAALPGVLSAAAMEPKTQTANPQAQSTSLQPMATSTVQGSSEGASQNTATTAQQLQSIQGQSDPTSSANHELPWDIGLLVVSLVVLAGAGWYWRRQRKAS